MIRSKRNYKIINTLMKSTMPPNTPDTYRPVSEVNYSIIKNMIYEIFAS